MNNWAQINFLKGALIIISGECAKLLKNYEGKPTLVFCNKTDTSLWLSKSLEDLGVNNLLLTGYDSYQVSCVMRKMIIIVPDKKIIQNNIFLFLHQDICYGYSLKAPWCRNKKNVHISGLNKSILPGARDHARCEQW